MSSIIQCDKEIHSFNVCTTRGRTREVRRPCSKTYQYQHQGATPSHPSHPFSPTTRHSLGSDILYAYLDPRLRPRCTLCLAYPGSNLPIYLRRGFRAGQKADASKAGASEARWLFRSDCVVCGAFLHRCRASLCRKEGCVVRKGRCGVTR